MLTGSRQLGMRRASEIIDGLDPEWDSFLIRALEDGPEKRYADAGEMLEALKDLLPSVSRRAQAASTQSREAFAEVTKLLGDAKEEAERKERWFKERESVIASLDVWRQYQIPAGKAPSSDLRWTYVS